MIAIVFLNDVLVEKLANFAPQIRICILCFEIKTSFEIVLELPYFCEDKIFLYNQNLQKLRETEIL